MNFIARSRFFRLALCLLITLLSAPLAYSSPLAASAQILLPRTGISAEEIALIINDDDPLSRQIGEYYQKARHIPAANLIRVHFSPGRSALGKDEFAQLRTEIERAKPAHIQTYAVAWSSSYRVGCMSMTSALAFGFNEDYCSTNCGQTTLSPYFNSPSLYPASEHKMQPAMMLAGSSFEQVKALIDRGIAADQSFPAGRTYLLSTPDKARSVRAAYFELTAKELAGVFPIEILETGATVSYGTVVEPCNHPQKFPFPVLAIFHFASGASAIEAYWKSVAWPGEGVFVGEPLARPFAPKLQEVRPGQF